MPKNFSPEQEFSGINLSSGFHLSKKYGPMRGIIFPISENTFRITFSIRKYTSLLNYFSNELFFLPNGTPTFPNNGICRLPAVFYFRTLFLLLIFIIHLEARTTISGSQKQKKQISTTASGSTVAFPFTRDIKLGNGKITEDTFLH